MAGRGVAKKPECEAKVGDRGRPSPFRKDSCKNGHDLSVTRRRYGKAKHALCVRCAQDSQNRSRAKNPKKYSEIANWNNKRNKFGVTKEMYEAMLASQNGVCAICKGEGITSVYPRLHIDHDHKTGAVRGLLCHGCNIGLGSVRESITILDAMKEYLRSLT